MQYKLCWSCFIPWRDLVGGRSPWGIGTFVPLPKGKPQQPQWSNPSPHFLNHWCKFELPCDSGSDQGGDRMQCIPELLIPFPNQSQSLSTSSLLSSAVLFTLDMSLGFCWLLWNSLYFSFLALFYDASISRSHWRKTEQCSLFHWLCR